MKKKEFLQKLDAGLSSLSKEEREDILADYEEHFRVGAKKKRSESAIAKELGSPADIIKQLKLDSALAHAKEKASPKNVWRAVFATIGLGFVNIVIVLSIFCAVWAVIISLFATGLAVTASGISLMIACWFLPTLGIPYISGSSVIGVFFVGIGLTLFGILFSIGSYYVTKLVMRLIVKYLQFNRKIIRGAKE